MQQSSDAKKSFYRESFSNLHGDASYICKKKVSSKIIVIINHYNFSAALGFIDELKMMTKNIYLIGARADRFYMEVRSIGLPSKNGEFFFPIKVYRNRTRGDNIFYKPDVVLDPKIINTHNIESIIIENDL